MAAPIPVVVEDVWACCDNSECEKWRRLPPGTVLDETKEWFCYMNPDPFRNSCDAPEEAYDKEAENNSQYYEQGERIDPVKLPAKPEPAVPSSAPPAAPSVSQAAAPLPAVAVLAPQTSAAGPASACKQPAWPQRDPGAQQAAELAKVQKEHQAFQKLVQKGGLWENPMGKGQVVVAPPPQWLWDGLAAWAPEAAQLACEGVDTASAAAYFKAVPPHGQACADAVEEVAQLVMTAAAAMAAGASGEELEAETPHTASQPPGQGVRQQLAGQGATGASHQQQGSGAAAQPGALRSGQLGAAGSPAQPASLPQRQLQQHWHQLPQQQLGAPPWQSRNGLPQAAAGLPQIYALPPGDSAGMLQQMSAALGAQPYHGLPGMPMSLPLQMQPPVMNSADSPFPGVSAPAMLPAQFLLQQQQQQQPPPQVTSPGKHAAVVHSSVPMQPDGWVRSQSGLPPVPSQQT